MKCLLIETKDKRKFITTSNNLKTLSQFIKIFEAKTSIINCDNDKILTLEQLISVFCGTSLPKAKIDIKAKINKYLETQKKNNIKITLKDLKERFKKYKIPQNILSDFIKKENKNV